MSHHSPPSSSYLVCSRALSSSSLEILSIHLILSTSLRHLLMNTCILFRQEVLAFHVSHPNNRTDFTVELKVLSFTLSEISLVLKPIHSLKLFVYTLKTQPVIKILKTKSVTHSGINLKTTH